MKFDRGRLSKEGYFFVGSTCNDFFVRGYCIALTHVGVVLYEADIDPIEIIREQQAELERVTHEEAWFLGERLHRHVHHHEWDVQIRVADIWLANGHIFRNEAIKRIRERKTLS
ncbi:MAG: hypothetical protein ACI9TH_000216 [Kiritimatiellia bacterium]|jgi:hypothetical protein